MVRLRDGGGPAVPGAGGCWLAGLTIGAAIMAMAAQAMVLGAGAAIGDAALNGDRMNGKEGSTAGSVFGS